MAGTKSAYNWNPYLKNHIITKLNMYWNKRSSNFKVFVYFFILKAFHFNKEIQVQNKI